MINKQMAVLGLALTLVGCDHPDMLSSSQIKWEPVATDYLNKHLVKPKGVQSEWKLEVKNDQGIQIVSVFIDGEKAAWTGCNPTNGASDEVRRAWPVCAVLDSTPVIAIHWNESSGYRVGSSAGPRFGGDYDVEGDLAVALLDGMRPMFKVKGVTLPR